MYYDSNKAPRLKEIQLLVLSVVHGFALEGLSKCVFLL